MELQSTLAGRAYAAAQESARPEAGAQGGFAEMARQAVQTVQAGEQAAIGAMTGGVDPHAMVEALAATELAVETAVTLRDKVVEAYQEILRMPV